MKQFSEEQIDGIIRLKWGRLVTEPSGPSLTSNRALGKLFKVSGSQIRKLYLARFEALKRRQLPFMEQLQHKKKE